MADTTFKPQWFHILLALADQPRHGYGIQREVLDRTDGGLTLWPAMLYRSLAALSDRGWIEPVEDPTDEAPDARRQYYTLTESGRVHLAAEADRLMRWGELARERSALDEVSSA